MLTTPELNADKSEEKKTYLKHLPLDVDVF